MNCTDGCFCCAAWTERLSKVEAERDMYQITLKRVLNSEVVKTAPYVSYSEVIADARVLVAKEEG